ncbi:hypothetical protein BH10ACT3_BH10ACT3_11560 [soil metagenome]
MQLAALVGYELLVVIFAVVMLLSLIGVSIIGLVRSASRGRPTKEQRRRSPDR